MSPRRDPETGKFVSGTGLPGMDGLVKQTGQFGAGIPAADLAGGNPETHRYDSPEVGMEVAGGDLSRDQEAELVAVFVMDSLDLPGTATGETNAVLSREWNFDEDPDIVSSASEQESNLGTQASIDVTSTVAEDIDVLEFAQLQAQGQHSDSVNGLAAGGDVAEYRRGINYVLEAGAGPTYHADDVLHLYLTFDAYNVSDTRVASQHAIELWWQVRDR